MVEIFAIAFSLLLRIAQKRREFDHQGLEETVGEVCDRFSVGFSQTPERTYMAFPKPTSKPFTCEFCVFIRLFSFASMSTLQINTHDHLRDACSSSAPFVISRRGDGPVQAQSAALHRELLRLHEWSTHPGGCCPLCRKTSRRPHNRSS
jgi:hypothetical protein